MEHEATTLARHRTVLHRVQREGTGQFVWFAQDDDEGVLTITIGEPFRLARGLWEEMGSPDQITLTVEPGDLLNEQG